MSENRLTDYLDHMQQAATDACNFVEGLTKEDFLEDQRTQQAVIMSLIIRRGCHEGDGWLYRVRPSACASIVAQYARHAYRIAHGYFDINLDVVWSTVQAALPELLKQLAVVRQDAEDRNDRGIGHDGR